MSLSSVRVQFRIFASTRQLIVVRFERIYTPFSMGMLYGVFICRLLHKSLNFYGEIKNDQ